MSEPAPNTQDTTVAVLETIGEVENDWDDRWIEETNRTNQFIQAELAAEANRANQRIQAEMEADTIRANQLMQAEIAAATPRADIHVQVFSPRSRSSRSGSGSSKNSVSTTREAPIQIHYTRVSYPNFTVLIVVC
jgi:hypothetical protein